MITLLKLKRKKNRLPMNLFFIELLIVLMFFSLSGAIILKMFVTADQKALLDASYEKALLDVQSFSEMYAKTGDLKRSADTVYGAECLIDGADGSKSVVLDEDGRPLITREGRNDYGRVWIQLFETEEETVCGKYSEVEMNVFLLGNSVEEVYQSTCCAYIPSFEAEDEDTDTENGGVEDA